VWPATSGVATAQPVVWFRAPLEYAAGDEPRHLAVGDFNRDGKRDLAVTNSRGPNVAILTGNGNGTFRRSAAYPAGLSPQWVAVWDLNGDGYEDLTVADAAEGQLAVLLNRGDGTFDPAVYYSAGAAPLSIAIADFNLDGTPDVAVTNVSATTVSLLFGNGDGSFQAPTAITTTTVPYHLATADLDHDGVPDLVATRFKGHAVVMLGNGDGTFQLEELSEGQDDRAIAIADLNGDGHQDLVLQWDNVHGNDLAVRLGNGDGTFQPRRDVAAQIQHSLAVADLNNDGRLDLASVNWISGAVTLLGNGDGTFQPAIDTQVGYAVAVAAADFNGDGKADVATANEGSTVSIRFGIGDGTFFDTPALPFDSCASRILSGDFNRDGIADLAAARCDEQSHTETGVIAVMLGTGNARFTAPVDYGLGAVAVAGDWNGDAIVDLAGRSLEEAGVATLLGNSDGTFRTGPGSVLSALSIVMRILPGDFNGDGIPDMLATGYVWEGSTSSYGLAIALGHGDGSFAPGLFLKTSDFDEAMAVGAGDFNLDGHVDVACSIRSLTDAWDVWMFFGNGDGTLVQGGSYAVGAYPHLLKVGDLNADGRPDIVTGNFESHNVSVLVGNGDGTFQPAATYYGGGNAPSAMTLSDFTGDGVIDVAVANEQSNNVSILAGRGDGTLTVLGVSFGTQRSPKDLAAGDFNGDGQLDLITVDFYTHQMSTLINRTQPTGAGKQ